MGKIVDVYHTRTDSLKVIFESYSALHDVYRGVLSTANIPEDKMELYDKTKKSAEEKQKDLSDSLHTQAFILMTGSVEALLKDLLEDLILENFIKMNSISGIEFSLDEMKRIIQKSEQGDFVTNQLAESVIRQLFNNKNVKEKINFQNTETMVSTFRRMFNIDIGNIDTNLLDRITVNWMKRHVLVHSDGIVDQRYINNTKKVGHEVEKEGDKIVITKAKYDIARNDFEQLFKLLEVTISNKGLSIEGLG